MTDKTGIYSARVPKDVLEAFEGMDKRKVLENLVNMLWRGEIIKDGDGFAVGKSVDTKTESVNTCEGCEYLENALDMSKFNEVCEYKGLDRQKALDRCVQMLWR